MGGEKKQTTIWKNKVVFWQEGMGDCCCLVIQRKCTEWNSAVHAGSREADLQQERQEHSEQSCAADTALRGSQDRDSFEQIAV